MPRPAAEILHDIAQFAPVEGRWLPLDQLLDELWSVPPLAPPESVPVLLGVFERFPQDDGAGVLWSIVHGLESLPYDYVPMLRESAARAPSQMATIMLVRLANAAAPPR